MTVAEGMCGRCGNHLESGHCSMCGWSAAPVELAADQSAPPPGGGTSGADGSAHLSQAQPHATAAAHAAGPEASPAHLPGQRSSATSGPPPLAGLLRSPSNLFAAIAVIIALALGIGWLTTANSGGRISAAPNGAPASSRAPDVTTEPPYSEADSDDQDDEGSESNPVTVTCWDGSSATDLASCGNPDGIGGMKYMFPTLKANLDDPGWDCEYDDYPSRKDGTETFSYDCWQSGATEESTDLLVRYRYWGDSMVSLNHYAKIYEEHIQEPMILNGREVGTIFQSTEPLSVAYGRYATAFVMLNGRMTLSVEAFTEDDLAALRDEQAVFRSPDEFSGFSGDSPSELTWTGE